MDAKQKQIDEINRYVEAMKHIASICKTPTVIGYKKISKEMKIQGIAIGAMCDMGYLKRVSYGKYVWNTTAEIEPIMARNVMNLVKNYYAEKHRQRLLQSPNKSGMEETKVDIDTPVLISEGSIDKPTDTVKKRRIRKPKETTSPQLIEKTIKIFGIPIYSSITRKI